MEEAPAAISLRELVEAGAFAVDREEADAPERGAAGDDPTVETTGQAGSWSLSFAAPPRVQRVASGLHWRTAVLTQPGTWTWEVTVPAGGRLHLGVESFAAAGAKGEPPPLEVVVSVVDGERRKALRVVSPGELDAPDWLDLELDLVRWSGRRVRLEIAARVVGEPARRAAAAEIAWAPARIVADGPVAAPIDAASLAGTAASAANASARGPAIPAAAVRPSILLIVIDTLRPDYLWPYGAPRWNSPSIGLEVARRGIVFENAYAQAPWTLPSMVSLLTGVLPGVLLGTQVGSFAIPPEHATLPELLSAAGYDTAAFIGNPTLHQGNGFGRGLDDLYISPPETAFVTLEDELLVRKASSWLRARGGRPFYAHVHFLAPHDPYANPVQFLGRSPRRPFYLGRVNGRDVHDLFLGTKTLDDPAEDVPHLEALYATEVRWVDRWVGRLLDAVPAERRANTIVVVTSDHGEELYEHGGFKHGRTLYEEQLRVPLLVRWEAALPASRRIEAPVRLVDLAPTLLEAAGVRAPDRSLSGRSLLPHLLAGDEPEDAAVFAERLNFGPAQAAVVSRGKKLVLFDLYGRAPTEGSMQERLVEEEAAKQPRIALYDLDRDPLERRNLVAEAPALLRRLLPLVHRGLDRTTPGLRVLAGSLPAGARLDVTVRFEAAPSEWRSYFLGGADGAGIVDRELRLDLAADVIEKGAVVLGDWRRVESIEARLDGVEIAAERIWLPRGAAAGTLPLDLAMLSGEAPDGAEAEGSPPPLLYLWVPAAGVEAAPEGRPDAETLHRLRALGYV
ncbi:MAG TPA: sulfatase [Thermoanaerobaculia bacterium]|nr:sulfatase [Thermoanaerobaculia bacterium]